MGVNLISLFPRTANAFACIIPTTCIPFPFPSLITCPSLVSADVVLVHVLVLVIVQARSRWGRNELGHPPVTSDKWAEVATRTIVTGT